MIGDCVFEEGGIFAEVNLAHVSQCEIYTVVCDDAQLFFLFTLAVDEDVLDLEVFCLPAIEVVLHPVPEILLSDLVKQLNTVLVDCKDFYVLGPDETIERLLIHDLVKRGQQPKLLLYLCVKDIHLILGVDDVLDDFVGLAEAGRQVSLVKRYGSLDYSHSLAELDDLKVVGIGEEDKFVVVTE